MVELALSDSTDAADVVGRFEVGAVKIIKREQVSRRPRRRY